MKHVLINTYRDHSHLFVDSQCLLSEEGTTQGDPLAMAMYAIGIQSLIHKLDGIANQSWYADDSAAASNIAQLRRWWDPLVEIGPQYGYFPNGAKTHILAKPQHLDKARKTFEDTPMTISDEGEIYLGGAMGTNSFAEHFVKKKVESWVKEVEKLSIFAETQPHAAYAALTHGLTSKWSYLLRVIDWDKLSPTELLQPLESAIQTLFIPAITGQAAPGKLTRDLLALPVRLGGLGVCNLATEQNMASTQICAPLVDCIVNQCHLIGNCPEQQREAKAKIRTHKHSQHKEAARTIQDQLPQMLQHLVELSQEKGASVWLTSLPIKDHRFALHKSAFRDALSLCYGWPVKNQPSHCSCGNPFSIEHSLSCKTGGYPALRHNEVRDLTASWLTEVCHGVAVEPHLQSLSGEQLSYSSAITEDRARLDVAMYGFWGGRFEKAFLDVRVFNPCTRSNHGNSLRTVYRRHEQEKRRQYEQRI